MCRTKSLFDPLLIRLCNLQILEALAYARAGLLSQDPTAPTTVLSQDPTAPTTERRSDTTASAIEPDKLESVVASQSVFCAAQPDRSEAQLLAAEALLAQHCFRNSCVLFGEMLAKD